jgi:hypothetical protein
MKKRNLFVILPLVSFLATGCDFWDNLFGKKTNYTIKPEITGGTKAEQNAILEAINFKPICMQYGEANKSIYPDITPEFKEDDGDNLVLAKKVKIQDKTVNIEWKIDLNQNFLDGVPKKALDASNDFYEIQYKGYQEEGGSIKWSIAKISCGGASSVNDKKLQYSADIVNTNYLHDDMDISTLNTITDVEKVVAHVDSKGKKAVYKFPSYHPLIDYTDTESYSPYFSFQEENAGKKEEYHHVYVKGKVVYASPDGKWGILGNGQHFTEIFAGSGRQILPVNFPNLKNEYVMVDCNIGQYMGNIQLVYIDNIKAIDQSEVTEPDLTYLEIDKEFIKSLKNPAEEGYDSQRQFVNGFSNSLRKVTGKIKLDTLIDRNGNKKTPSELVDDRFSFQIEVGDGDDKQLFTVAYDYHVAANNKALFEEFRSKLKDGKTLEVKGTMHYSGSNSFPFLSLAYEQFAATATNYVKNKANLFTRVGDTEEFVSVGEDAFDSSKVYYKRSDKNSGAVWNIVPLRSGDMTLKD